jgi:hypothetical protein
MTYSKIGNKFYRHPQTRFILILAYSLDLPSLTVVWFDFEQALVRQDGKSNHPDLIERNLSVASVRERTCNLW